MPGITSKHQHPPPTCFTSKVPVSVHPPVPGSLWLPIHFPSLVSSLLTPKGLVLAVPSGQERIKVSLSRGNGDMCFLSPGNGMMEL